MKKVFLALAATLIAAVPSTAQTLVNFSEVFGIPQTATPLNEPIAKGANGVVIIGDYRQNVEEGHSAGLSYAKKAAYFTVEGQTIKAEAAVNMVKYPTGVQKNYQIIPTRIPVNRSLMLKAETDGNVQVLYASKKGKGRMFMGVFRNGKWEYLGEQTWENGTTAGSENNPYKPLKLDYPAQAGDVIMLFAGAPVDVYGIYYTGKLVKDFKGDDPRAFRTKKKSSKKSK